eukprot:6197119-Pleurochrysis_carterae.AAC.3
MRRRETVETLCEDSVQSEAIRALARVCKRGLVLSKALGVACALRGVGFSSHPWPRQSVRRSTGWPRGRSTR